MSESGLSGSHDLQYWAERNEKEIIVKMFIMKHKTS